MLGKAAGRTDQGHLKSAYAGPGAPESQNCLAKQIEKKDFETNLMPTPCLSPPGRRSEPCQKTPDPIVKAEDRPGHQVPASLKKTSLKEVSGEKLNPVPEVCVSGFRLRSVVPHGAHISSSIYFSLFG